MVERLLFRLAGPMASWGEIAVGEIRSSWPEPSKSAVLGLVAAALGVKREERDKHRALHEGLSFAVRVHQNAVGRDRSAKPRPLRDYHTAQAPSARRGAYWPTRADELDRSNDLNTILSERWYWQHFAATVALTRRNDAAPALPDIEAALRAPAYPLALGRRACPPGRPLAPKIVAQLDLAAAFQEYDDHDATLWSGLIERASERPENVVPGDQVWRDCETGEMASRSRRDAVRDRAVWTFDDRGEVALDIVVRGDG